MRFGCCIKNIDEISTLKNLGYDYFEFAGSVLAAMSEDEFEALCLAAKENALPCLGFNAYCAGTPAIVGENVSAEETEAYARLICERGAKLGAKNIGIGAPKARVLPAGYDLALAHRQCAAFLRITCRVAAEYGMNVLLEAVHDRMCNYLNYTHAAIKLMRELDIENLYLVNDFYHMEVMDESFDEVLSAGDRLMHTHISTCGDDLSRSFPQEDERGKYEEIFSLLKSMNYDGSMSIEPGSFDAGLADSCLKMLKSV